MRVRGYEGLCSADKAEAQTKTEAHQLVGSFESQVRTVAARCLGGCRRAQSRRQSAQSRPPDVSGGRQELSARAWSHGSHDRNKHSRDGNLLVVSKFSYSETSENYLPSRVTACTTSTPGHIRFRGIVGGHATPVAATQWRPGTHRDRLERSLTDFKPSVTHGWTDLHVENP